MTLLQIEAWARNIISQIENGRPYEDSRVELKREWPDDPVKAARQIAAHANAARGASILWLVGIDQRAGVVGATPRDLANWWPQVVSAFDSVAPSVRDLVITHENCTVTALHMETDRAPYVVTVPGGQQISHEVPWRDGTRTRSAKRDDLVRLLVPLQVVPMIDVLGATMQMSGPNANSMREIQARLTFYLTPLTSARIVIPRHTCELDVHVLGGNEKVLRLDVDDFARDAQCAMIHVTSSQAVFDGPALLAICGRTMIPYDACLRPPSRVELRASIAPAGGERRLPLSVTLETAPTSDGTAARWASAASL